MKKLETIQKLAKAGKILSKIVYVLSIVGVVCGFVSLLLMIFLQDSMLNNRELMEFIQAKENHR